MKATLLNILVYFIVKYLLFYLIFLVYHGNYTLLEIENIVNGSSLLYFIIMLLPLPVLSIILLAYPLYWSFRLKNGFLFIFLVVSIFVAEYFIYEYLTSDRGITRYVLFFLSLILLGVLFKREIKSKLI